MTTVDGALLMGDMDNRRMDILLNSLVRFLNL